MVLESLYCAFLLCILPLSFHCQETPAINYFLNKTGIQPQKFSLQKARNGQLPTSDAEKYRDLFATGKILLMQQYYQHYKFNYEYTVNTGRLQPQISANKPFPCALNNTRSAETPSSVHRLRPGDIDVIGAMGDSITAGTAMMSKTFPQLFIEFRGQTVLGGGLKDWRTFLTLPNILKVFNPNLYGYAVANTLAKFRSARFNVAEPFAIVQDMPYMAEVLVKRMKSDPKVDMQNHWKLISIFIGANDVCNDMCYYDNVEDFLANHRKYLHRTLTILRKNIPRLLVNLIAIPDIDNTIRVMKGISPACEFLHKFSCHCIISDSIKSKKQKEISQIIKRFQQIYYDVASMPEFQLDDFAAVPRMDNVNKTLATLKNGNTDLRFFAVDCFHFSQYGNAAFANILWNSMMQVKTKEFKTIMKPFEVFSCPSEDFPYISTLKNS